MAQKRVKTMVCYGSPCCSAPKAHQQFAFLIFKDLQVTLQEPKASEGGPGREFLDLGSRLRTSPSLLETAAAN